MKRIPHQLLELNSPFVWNWEWFLRCASAAKTFGYTGIIIHQQELFALLAPPSSHSPRLSVENLVHQKNNALLHLNRVGQFLAKNAMSFWLQGEAAPNDDILKRKYPEYDLDNVVPGDFWTRLYDSTLTELIAHVPTVNGIIFSLTMPDSQPEPWEQGLQYAWKLLRRHGKTLILRDFIDANWPRRQLISVLSHLPSDIRASIKATELDYHPGFANHPHIAMLPSHKKWIEYDLWGTGYGWSFLPCYLADDIQARLNWATHLDGEPVEAITSRICWQWLPNNTTLDSANIVNLIGFDVINSQAAPPTPVIESRWMALSQVEFRHNLDRDSFFTSFPASYNWLVATPNILGRRLHYQSQIPDDLSQAQQLLHMDTRSANLLQAFQPFLPPDDIDAGIEQRKLIALEKEHALFIAANTVKKLTSLARQVNDPNGFFRRTLDSWRIAEAYCKMFSAVTHATTDAIFLEHYGAHTLSLWTLYEHQTALRNLAHEIDQFNQGFSSPQYTALPLLLSPDRLINFADSLR